MTSHQVPLEALTETGGEGASELYALGLLARQYLGSFRWCQRVKQLSYDRGDPHLCVFLAEIEPLEGADDEVWVLFGDIPPAYMDTYYARNGAEAVAGYVGAMQEHLRAYRSGEDTSEQIPILDQTGSQELELTADLAELLEKRIQFIVTRILPLWQDEIGPFPDEDL